MVGSRAVLAVVESVADAIVLCFVVAKWGFSMFE